jgi:hypothetical protein
VTIPLPVHVLSVAALLAATTAAQAAEPPALPIDPEPRSLILDVESRVRRQGATPSVSVSPRPQPLSSRPARAAGLQYPGRAWPFAVAAAADATTTCWAIGRGASERNPVLALGGLDLGMVKIIQFPLLAKAIDTLEARHPRLGRPLRWAVLVFHAALAINNVRMGLAAGQLRVEARPRRTP